jgi:hypothetical protein
MSFRNALRLVTNRERKNFLEEELLPFTYHKIISFVCHAISLLTRVGNVPVTPVMHVAYLKTLIARTQVRVSK